MSGLFDMLGSAARALDAQRFGLDVTGQNIANVNTPGYARRVPLLSEGRPRDEMAAGGGVEIDGVRSVKDRFIQQRLWREWPAEQRQGAIAEMLAAVEVSMGEAGASLDNRLSEFFDAFARLAEAPTSSTARQEVLLQGRALASAFNQLSDTYVTAQGEADRRVGAAVDDINAIAARIAKLNAALGSLTVASGEALHLRDEVRVAVSELTRIADVEVVERADGGFDIALGGGRALVVGDRVWELTTASRPITGFADVVSSDGTVITGQINGGSLAGFLHVRDTLLPGYRATLDELAHGVVQEVNALHSSGFDINGAAGQPFFAPLASSTDASELIAVNGALLATGGEALVAASGDATAVGNNDIARALAQLRDEPVVGGGTATFGEYWSRLVYRVGRDTEAARDEQRSRAELVRQVEALEESVSGVSLDEEAANLMRFQRAYEANARYFRVIDDALSTLMQIVRT